MTPSRHRPVLHVATSLVERRGGVSVWFRHAVRLAYQHTAGRSVRLDEACNIIDPGRC